jgi:sigma-B regulation protein RsbU (phosphoserine phosphatase)
VIADVTDKGMPAALFMAHARSILRASVSGPFPPAKAITTANRLICTDPTEGMFVSLYYVNIQPERDELICVNAGHNPPYHFNAKEKSLSELPRGGMPLGIEETTEYQELAVPFQPGDFMLLYTDGVTEASNRELHFFGTDRLNKILSKNQKGSPEKIRTAIDAAVSHFMGTTNPSDDITLVVIKRG